MDRVKSQDGGINALAGFLYQLVGTLSLTANVSCEKPLTQSTDELSVMFKIPNIRDAFQRAEHETYEDALLRFRLNEEDETVLIQFKYSSNKRKIGGPELKMIFQKMDDVIKEVKNSRENVTAWILVTNREFTEGKSGTSEEIWEKESNSGRSFRLEYLLLPLIENFEVLKSYARQYGSFDKEIQDGIHKLLGKLLQDTATELYKREVFEEDLKYAFTNSRYSLPLTSQSVEEVSSKRIGSYLKRIYITEKTLVHREILRQISQVATERALIVLEGIGGCGKTVALWNWLKESGPFKALKHIQEVPANFVTKEVCNWANLDEGHDRYHDTFTKTLKRVTIANPDQDHPIIHIGIDGIDEELNDIERADAIRKLIREFWEEDTRAREEERPPTAVLLITCRRKEELDEKHWLPTDISGLGSPELPKSLTIDLFSLDELAVASTTLANILVRKRLVTNLTHIKNDSLSFPMAFPIQFAPRFESQGATLVNRDILQALRHPTVWRSFHELNPAHQLSILGGDDSALDQLAKRFLDRVCKKLIQRRKLDLLEELPVVMSIFQRIAQATILTLPPYDLNSNWKVPALYNSYINEHNAYKLYKEALSGGLICETERNSWRWTYEWIPAFLTNVSIEDYYD